jgi:hypothetical protein
MPAFAGMTKVSARTPKRLAGLLWALPASGLLERKAARTFSLPCGTRQGGTARGTRKAAILLQLRWAARLARPARGIILKPHVAAYRQWHRRGASAERALPDGPRVTSQAGEVETPEAGPLAWRGDPGLSGIVRPRSALPYRATPGAAPLVPNDRRSAARVLMDEGWMHCTRGFWGGTKADRFPSPQTGEGKRLVEGADKAGIDRAVR